MDDLNGVDALHGLISHPGVPELHALLEADVDEAHRIAHVRNSMFIVHEAWGMRPNLFDDRDLVTRILELEGEKGVWWAA
jgi:hypothetical protein